MEKLSLRNVMLRIVCAFAMAFAFVPLSAAPAFATRASGDTFVIDNVIYKVNSTVPANVYVQGIQDKDTMDSVLTIPASVTSDEGVTYTVVGLERQCFKDCTRLEDVRLGDSTSAIEVYPQSFDGCSNLKVIHFMGDPTWCQPAHQTYSFDSAVDDIKLIFHKGSFAFENAHGTDIEGSDSGIVYPNKVTAYFAVNFQTEDPEDSSKVDTTTVYVKGGSLNNNKFNAGPVYADLANLTADQIYTDGDICTGTVPAMDKGCDAWAVSTDEDPVWEGGAFNNAFTLTYSLDNIASCVTAKSVTTKDLLFSTMVLSSEDLRYRGYAICPDVTVVDANGNAVDPSNYAFSYNRGTSPGNDPTSKDRMINVGNYVIKATGTNDYYHSCYAVFHIVDESISWRRVTGKDRYAQVRSIASDAGISTNSFAVLVNPDDYASCAIGASLAGLLDCAVLTSGTKEMPDSTAVALASSSKATVLVVGGSDVISDAVKDKASDATAGASRVTSSSDPAQMALDVLSFVAKAKSGEYSIDIEDEYGDSALLLSTTPSAANLTFLSWAYSVNAPVFFMDEAGTMSAATVQALSAYKTVRIPGASASAAQAVAGQLPGVDVESSIASGDVYQSAYQYAADAVAKGEASYATTVVAAPSDYGVVAAAACSTAVSGGVLLLADSTDAGKQIINAMGKDLINEISTGIVCLGYNDLPAASYEELIRSDNIEDYNNLYFATVSLSSNVIKTTGTATAPKVTVVDSQGNTLTEGKDYRLAYYNNDTSTAVAASALATPGSYTVTAKGTADATAEKSYINCRSASFEVVLAVPAKVAGLKLTAGKKKLTAKWTATAGATAYQVGYKLSTAKSWTTKAVSKATLALSKLKSGKKYQVRVRAKNAAGYGAWCSAKAVKVK